MECYDGTGNAAVHPLISAHDSPHTHTTQLQTWYGSFDSLPVIGPKQPIHFSSSIQIPINIIPQWLGFKYIRNLIKPEQ